MSLSALPSCLMSGGPSAGSEETRKSSAEATPSGVSQATSSGSNETQKSSAEATPPGVLSNTAAAANTSSSRNGGKTRGTSKSRSGAGRAAKPPRQKCPHCGKWGGHRPDECWSRPAGPSVVNHFSVAAGARVYAGAVTSGRVAKSKAKAKGKKGGKTSTK